MMFERPALIPGWIRRASYGFTSPLDRAIVLGLWDMRDGDYYANGRWNPKVWETFEKTNAHLHRTPVPPPPFPQLMKRAYDALSDADRTILLDGFSEIAAIIQGAASRPVDTPENEVLRA